MSQVAETIRQQIGHRAFVMMGASNLLAGEKHLQFKIGANGKRVTHVTVTLDTAQDLYVVRFDRVTKTRFNAKTGAITGGCVKLNEIDGVHVEDLHRIISEQTGLYLSL